MKKTFTPKNFSNQFQCHASRLDNGQLRLTCKAETRSQQSIPQSRRKARVINCSSNTPPTITDQPYVGGDPICPINSLGLRILAPITGVYDFGAGLSLTIESDSPNSFSWSSSKPGITDLVVRQGANQRRYSYTNDEQCGTNLQAPSGLDIAHIDICYNLEKAILQGLQTAQDSVITSSFERMYNWSVSKTPQTSNQNLAIDQSTTIDYQVAVSETHVDSKYTVNGSITLTNSNTDVDQDLTISQITGISPQPTLPITLAPLEQVTIPYTINPSNQSAGTSYVQITVSRYQTSRTVTQQLNWNFDEATVTLVDECVTVTDSENGLLGQLCAPGQTSQTYNLTQVVGPYSTCGPRTINSSSTLTVNDTDTTSSSSATINVAVACPPSNGCTRGVCYWKNNPRSPKNVRRHRSGDKLFELGGAWDLLPNQEDTIFFNSSQTWGQVIQTPPSGNAYYILAREYIAATLNELSGANIEVVDNEMDLATALFNQYTPGQIDRLPKHHPVITQLKNLAVKLENFNEGRIGPGSCSGILSPYSQAIY